jgi:DNA-binding winged helix-turn-helix (wHTH) protein
MNSPGSRKKAVRKFFSFGFEGTASGAELLQRFSSFSLDTANQCVWRGEQRFQLAPKAYAVLSYLIAHAGRIVTKEELLEAAWPATFVQEAVLKTSILEIRKALGENPRNPRYIETIHRRGYRFDDREADGSGPAATFQPVTSDLVGRAGELKRLHDLWKKAVDGNRQFVFVSGDAGIGKSTLIEHFVREISGSEPLRMLRGQGIEHLGVSEAWYPVFDALGRAAKAGRMKEFPDVLRRYAPTWLVQLPGLASAHDRESLKLETMGATRDRMLREMCEAVDALAKDSPLLFLIEDLHWSDIATLDLISSMASRGERAHLLVLMSYRPVDVIVTNHPVRAARQSLLMQRKCVELELDLLNRSDVARLIAVRFPGNCFPDDFGNRLHDRTEGNPLFIANVLDFAVSHGLTFEENGQWRLKSPSGEFSRWVPENLAKMIEAQIERLTPREQAVLETASVAGVQFAVSLIAAEDLEDVIAVESCCDEMSRKRLFIRAAGVAEFDSGQMSAEYRFTHTLYLDVFYRRLSPARRMRLHRTVGERLERLAGNRINNSASELAAHFEKCRDHAKAVEYLKLVAQRCASRHALREALEALTRAIKLTETLPEHGRTAAQLNLIEQLGLAYRLKGQLTLASAEFERMYELAARAGNLDCMVSAQLWLASVLSWLDRARCLEAASAAMSLCSGEMNPQLRINVLGQTAYWNLLFRGWDKRDAAASAAALECAREANDRPAMALHASRHCFFQALSSQYRYACRTAEEGVCIATEVENLLDYSIAHYFEAWALLHVGEWGQMKRRLRSAIDLVRRSGHDLWVLLFELLETFLNIQAFCFDPARVACRNFLERARDLRHPLSEQIAFVLLGLAELGAGKLPAARGNFEALRSWQNRERILMDWIWKLPLQYGFAELCLAEGNIRAARAEVDLMFSLVSQTAERTWIALAHYMRARVSFAEGNDQSARSEVMAGLALADKWEMPVAAWRLHAFAAEIQMGEDHGIQAGDAILKIARSMDNEDDLKTHFLSAPPIKAIVARGRTAMTSS